MGTRSRIGVMHGDVCKSVYCHWDGYLEHNGDILLKHYDSAKANELVSLGDLSTLGREIGEQHDFDNEDGREGQCTFYGRDRGEQDVGWKVANSFEDFLEQVEGCGAEYYYVMRDGEWYAGCRYATEGLIKNGLVPLGEAVAAVLIAKAVAEDE
jgi:hypothetical protein